MVQPADFPEQRHEQCLLFRLLFRNHGRRLPVGFLVGNSGYGSLGAGVRGYRWSYDSGPHRAQPLPAASHVPPCYRLHGCATGTIRNRPEAPAFAPEGNHDGLESAFRDRPNHRNGDGTIASILRRRPLPGRAFFGEIGAVYAPPRLPRGPGGIRTGRGYRQGAGVAHARP